MSEPDSPPRKKKEVERPAKKKPTGGDPEPSGGVDLSSMTLIGPKRYIGPMEFKVFFHPFFYAAYFLGKALLEHPRVLRRLNWDEANKKGRRVESG